MTRLPWAGDNLMNATAALLAAMVAIPAIVATVVWLLR